MEVISHRRFINLRRASLLRAQAAGEIAEVIDRQRQVGVEGFADRLTVIPALRYRQIFQVGLNTVGNLQQQISTVLSRRFAPGVGGPVRRIKGEVDIFGIRTRKLPDVATVDRGGIHKEFSTDGFNKFTVNKVTVG
ncbi:Uncharacterised protein [Klebsiella michiganensis]|nr:Uncharacterised protein [Klebsiella michiganensis]